MTVSRVSHLVHATLGSLKGASLSFVVLLTLRREFGCGRRAFKQTNNKTGIAQWNGELLCDVLRLLQ